MAKTQRGASPVVGILALVAIGAVIVVGGISAAHAESTVRLAVPWFRSGASPLADEWTFSAQRTSDAAFVHDNLDGHWLAVLGWFAPKGATQYARSTAWDQHRDMRAEHHAVLLAGGATNGLPTAWITVAPHSFASAEDAQDWCRDVLGRSCRAVLPHADPSVIEPVVEP